MKASMRSLHSKHSHGRTFRSSLFMLGGFWALTTDTCGPRPITTPHFGSRLCSIGHATHASSPETRILKINASSYERPVVRRE
jgi:hypothetical protein